MKSKRDITASPYTPVAKGDILSSVRLYQRTAEATGETIAVCVFKRPQSDIARVAASSYADTYYSKVGPAGFTLHNDTDGCLYLSIDNYSGAGHFRALSKLGIKRMTVSSLSAEHGSENTKRAGIMLQNLTVEAGGFRLHYHAIAGMSDWFETHDGSRFARDGKVFTCASEFRWGEHSVIWCGGLDYTALMAEQSEARVRLAVWERDREERRRMARVEAEQARAAAETTTVTGDSKTEGN